MKSIIEDMYNGNLKPFGEINSKFAEDIAEKLVEEEHDILKQFPECKEAFEKYLNNSNYFENKFAYNQFLMGVRVGAQLILEMIYPIK